MLLQLSFFGVVPRHRPNQADGEILVHIVTIQMGGLDQMPILADDPVNTPEVFFYNAVALFDGNFHFKSFFLFVFLGCFHQVRH